MPGHVNYLERVRPFRIEQSMLRKARIVMKKWLTPVMVATALAIASQSIVAADKTTRQPTPRKGTAGEKQSNPRITVQLILVDAEYTLKLSMTKGQENHLEA